MSTLRYALRQLRHSPGYTVVALLILTLGIGVNTAMFSLLDALLFRDAPFPAPERLVQLVSRLPQGSRFDYSAIEIRELRDASPPFSELTAYSLNQYVLAEPDRPTERVLGVNASAGLFATFGMQPQLGRAFRTEECAPGRNQVIVLSHAFWQQRYGGDQSVLGRTLRLDGETVEIIGVMPAAFDYAKLWQRARFWRPLSFSPEQLEWRDYRIFNLLGRLAPGATAAQVDAVLASVARAQATAVPDVYSGLRYQALDLNRALTDDLGRRLSWLLSGLAGFVLLLVCANLANLQLARSSRRTRELAIRSALGASRARLLGQQLVESIVLALGGGVLGLGFGSLLTRVLATRLTLGGGAGALDLSLQPGVVGLTFALALLTGGLFGIVPAWLASRVDSNAVLKAQTRGGTAGRGTHRLREGLIVAEIALALVLLSGAALMQRGFQTFLQHDSGWDDNQVLTAALPVPETRYPDYADRIELFRRIEQRLTALPGVEHAALATSLPVFGYGAERPVFRDGQSQADVAILPLAHHVMVTADYFATMGISLVAGERFRPDLKPNDPDVIIVNEALARQLWPDTSPIGQRLCSMDSGTPYWAQVVGVARDVEAAAALGPPATRFTVYKPLAQEAWGWTYLVLRGPAPATLAEPLRRAMNEIDPDLPPDQIATVSQQIDYSQHNLRLAGQTLTAFGLLGLVLAAIGVYGVIAHLVSLRTSEFGIRLALGAQPADIRRIVLGQGARLGSIGLGLGSVGAGALGYFLHRSMPRLATIDPLAIGLVAALLAVVALLACYFPARRAMRVDPLVALRDE